MAYRWNRLWEASRLSDEASTTTSKTHLKSELTHCCGLGALLREGDVPSRQWTEQVAYMLSLTLLISVKHQLQFDFLYKPFRLWILYSVCFILSEEGVVFFFLF